MTIDSQDYESRPADDFFAGTSRPLYPITTTDDLDRAISLYCGIKARSSSSEGAFCHQLGCRFDELTHAI